jgi:hypothetical protein
MANQLDPATAGGSAASPAGHGASATGQEVTPFVSQVPGTPVVFPAYHGRRVSWVAVTIIMVAFVAGGLALVFGPTWWLFWVSLGLAGVGGLLALATGIFDDWY